MDDGCKHFPDGKGHKAEASRHGQREGRQVQTRTPCGERVVRFGYCSRCLSEVRAQLAAEIQSIKIHLVQKQSELDGLA